jgi:septal ring factor EnvC (AmiA/AmiB activator)
VRKHNALLQKVEENIRAVEALEAQFDDSIQEELYDSTTIENQLVEIQHTLAEAKAKIAAA